MKKLFNLFTILAVLFGVSNALYAQQFSQKEVEKYFNRAKLNKTIALATFQDKWMQHMKTDVCLPEEATEQVVVHRNSWDVVTRFLMGNYISADVNGNWLTGSSVYNPSASLKQKMPVIWNATTVASMQRDLVYFYSDYKNSASMAPQGGAKSTGPSRADDIDAPWDKTNTQLYQEFSDDLAALKKTLETYEKWMNEKEKFRSPVESEEILDLDVPL